MDIITITQENLEKEHICCAISNNKDCQVASKKQWLSDRLKEGLVFKKGDVRGKCFIEYIPAENAWVPIVAPEYMYIDCFWVSGQYKGQGNADLLLRECIKDSKEKGKHGLVVLSSQKKMPFLSDSKYLLHKGFQKADTAAPFFELYCLPFDDSAKIPYFKEQVKNPQIKENGYVLYYTRQCPFTAKYVPLVEQTAKENGFEFHTVLMETKEQAQNAPAAATTYALFYNGKYVTNEILSPQKFLKLAQGK